MVVHASSTYYGKIIPTAWLVAYRRALTDIPFSKEIFEKLDALREAHKFTAITDEMKGEFLTPQFEARYKLVNQLVLATQPTQLLEIAAGFAPRGLELTAKQNVTYVELDLPEVIRDKQDIVETIVRQNELVLQGRLSFVAGNALNLDTFVAATEQFDKTKPITIVNEGLLRYLSFPEKTCVARNVYALLEQYGGTWITPDITLQNVLFNEDETVRGHNARVQAMTGINTDKNRFENEEHAMAFFRQLGFTIERHGYSEVKDQLVSPKTLHMTDEAVDRMIAFPVVYVMRLTQN